MSDQAFGEFKRQIEYKSDWYGSKVAYVDRFFPSSKTCNACDHIKDDLKLSDRIFVCPACGHKADRVREKQLKQGLYPKAKALAFTA